jgi:hypothetical protein
MCGHRIKEQTEPGKQNSCRKWYANSVVNKGEEKVLADVAHSFLTQVAGAKDTAQVAFKKCDAARLHCHVRAGSHRDTDVGLGKSGRIVYSIAGHHIPAGFRRIRRDCDSKGLVARRKENIASCRAPVDLTQEGASHSPQGRFSRHGRFSAQSLTSIAPSCRPKSTEKADLCCKAIRARRP